MFQFRVALFFPPKELTEGSSKGLFSFASLFGFKVFSNINIIQFLKSL